MKATIPIAITPGTRILRIERVPGSYWKAWIHHNLTLTHGTFLLLYDDGRIERTTLNPDGSEYTITVKDAD